MNVRIKIVNICQELLELFRNVSARDPDILITGKVNANAFNLTLADFKV